jgi:hypothetical protein
MKNLAIKSLLLSAIPLTVMSVQTQHTQRNVLAHAQGKWDNNNNVKGGDEDCKYVGA